MLAEKCKIQKENTKNLCWPTNVYKTHTVDKSATPSVRFLSNRPYKHRRYHYHHHRFHFSSLFRLHFSPDERSVFFFIPFHLSNAEKKDDTNNGTPRYEQKVLRPTASML